MIEPSSQISNPIAAKDARLGPRLTKRAGEAAITALMIYRMIVSAVGLRSGPILEEILPRQAKRGEDLFRPAPRETVEEPSAIRGALDGQRSSFIGMAGTGLHPLAERESGNL
jgi:hypothetical protein